MDGNAFSLEQIYKERARRKKEIYLLSLPLTRFMKNATELCDGTAGERRERGEGR